MAIKPSFVSTFMGADFDLEHRGNCSATALAAELKTWADEVASWGDVQVSEACMLRGSLHVTLEEGIVQ